MTWILIVALTSAYGSSVSPVGEFSSVAACQNAGDKYVSQIRGFFVTKSYVCVEKS